MARPVDKIFKEAARLKEMNRCPFCKNIINQRDFRDDISRKEFQISGLCQSCQDEFFGGE